MGSRQNDDFFERPKRTFGSINKESSFKDFIPLTNLLKKNHEDRVQDYLKDMDENADQDDDWFSTKKVDSIKKKDKDREAMK